MAYYRASKVIKMRRNALGHSREEYAAEGPSYQTIYRLENGKVHLKEGTYRRLSRAMDTEESTRQGIIKTRDIHMLWLMNDISNCLYMKDYEEAEVLIQQLEDKLDISVERNKRYFEYIKADLLYQKEILKNEENEKIIKDSLMHGSRGLYELLEKKWPFEERECNRILSLVELVRRERDYERQKKLQEQLLALLETEYMEPGFNLVYRIIVQCRVGDVMGNMGLHREAIAVDEETIKLCEEQQEFLFAPEIYYDIFWNYMKIKEKETLTIQEEIYRKECLLKAYYSGKILCPGKMLYERRVREFYPEELF